MRALIPSLISLFILVDFCFSQTVTYKYPLHIQKYSNDVEKVEMKTESFSNLDLTAFTQLHEIKSDVVQVSTFKDGRILKIENLKDRLEFNYIYDDLLNIKSRISKSNILGETKSITTTFHLNQEESKLQVFQDSTLREEVLFDTLNRVKFTYSYFNISKGKQENRIEMIYHGDKLVGRKYFINDKLETETQITESSKDFQNEDGEKGKIISKTISTERIEYGSRTETNTIMYFDSDDNLIKQYNYYCENGNCTGLVSEFILSKI